MKPTSFSGNPNNGNVLVLQIFLKRAAKPSAGNPTFSRTFSGSLLNLTRCAKAFQTFSGTFSGTLLNLTWLCTKASWNLLRDRTLTWHAPKPPRPSPEPSEPSLEPRWTWPGACTGAHRNYSGLKTPLAYAVGVKTKAGTCFEIKKKVPKGPRERKTSKQ